MSPGSPPGRAPRPDARHPCCADKYALQRPKVEDERGGEHGRHGGAVGGDGRLGGRGGGRGGEYDCSASLEVYDLPISEVNRVLYR